MSLQNLISGAECALPSNPLSQVLKHTESDRSVQRDRIAGPSSSRLQHLASTSSAPANERDLALARQFFESNGSSGALGPALQATTLHLPPSDLVHRMDGAPPGSGQELHEAWMRVEMQKQNNIPMQPMQMQGSAWAAEFRNAMPMMQAPGPSNQQSYNQPQQQSFSRNNYMSSQYQSPMNMPDSMYGMSQQFNTLQDQGKGKGKSRQDDFEAAFAQFASSMPQKESARIVEVKDDVQELEGALRSASIVDSQKADSDAAEYGTDFQKIWDQLQHSEVPPPKEDLAKWEAEFNQLMSGQREDHDYDYGSSMQEAWESGLGNYNQDTLPSNATQFDDEGIPMLAEYVFEPNNEYVMQPTSGSSLAQAKALLAQNGSLTEAALLLEAAIQKGELGEGGYEAWILLGETRSMDEREEAGMRALTEGVKRAEQSGANAEGKLSLAISYTNESFERASLTMLMRWLLARFPTYTVPPETSAALKNSPWDSYQRVTDAFLTIARQQHSEGTVDADVQTGLGVLFYNNGDYSRAKDCFESALAVRPNDYLLWNRLGSSLSNGNKPEDALGAYREALQMRPTYTRAIYNVGVACLNIGAHKEAAEHFLSALALQDTAEGEKSEQLWFTLRRALISMQRHDLADKAKTGASVDGFRSDGFDF